MCILPPLHVPIVGEHFILLLLYISTIIMFRHIISIATDFSNVHLSTFKYNIIIKYAWHISMLYTFYK